MSTTTLETWLLRTSLGGGLLLVVTWALTYAFRQPARRQRLAEAGLVAALLVPVLATGPTWLTVAVPIPADPSAQPLDAAAPPPGPGAVAVGSGDEAWVELASSADPNPAESGSPAAEADAIGPVATAPLPLSAAAALPSPTPTAADGHAAKPRETRTMAAAPLSSALAATYGLVVAFFLLRWLLGHLRLRRILASGRQAPPPVEQLFRRLAHGAGRSPRLLVTGRLQSPVCCGVRRPTVLLPTALCAADRRTLRWVLAHELTHLERGDAWTRVLFALAQALYFYLPWLYLLRRQVRLCQEYVADAAAAGRTRHAADYAQFLVCFRGYTATPVGATGVAGSPSDLFRRIAMLCESPFRIERRCPRGLFAAGLGAFSALAVLIAGVGLRAPAAEVPAKPVPQATAQEPPAKPPDLPLPPPPVAAASGETAAPQRSGNPTQDPDARPRDPFQGFGSGFGFGGGRRGRGFAELGVNAQPPSATLAEQLDLPEGKGLVIELVRPNTPAAVAGIKPHDILLEFNGKPVGANVQDLHDAVRTLKPGTPVDVVVLRKGKKETLKGLKIPEAPREPETPPRVFGGGRGRGFEFNGQPPVVSTQNVITTNFRTDDRFTTRHQEGSLVITVTGTIDDGRAKVGQITVQDGGEPHQYAAVDKVPEAYRDKVKNLVELNGRSNIKVEFPSARDKPQQH